jgi:hypothetical protein
MSTLPPEHHFTRNERAQSWFGVCDPRGPAQSEPEAKNIPPGRSTTVVPELLPPFSDLVEIDCQDCGGRGYDPGGINLRAASTYGRRKTAQLVTEPARKPSSATTSPRPFA